MNRHVLSMYLRSNLALDSIKQEHILMLPTNYILLYNRINYSRQTEIYMSSNDLYLKFTIIDFDEFYKKIYI